MSRWFLNRVFLTFGVVLVVCGFGGAGDANPLDLFALADRALGTLLGFASFCMIEKETK